MTTKLASIFLFTAALGLSSCGEKEIETRTEVVAPLSQENPIITGTEVAPTKALKSNFKELKENPRAVYQITLAESALKQTFLLTVAEVSGPPTPTGHALANKIVFFEKKGGSLFMFESLDGKLSSSSVETRVLLAEFPIVKEANGRVTFDFKKGMKLVFEKRSMFISDAGKPDAGDTVYKITDSYIKTVELRGKYIFIDQIVRIDSQASMTAPASNFSRQIKYTLSTYKKNPNFKPKESNGQKKVGYFEVHPVLEAGSGKSTVNVMKFDTSKPVVYHVSPNVPADYIDAVNDGILYWNKVFKKDVMKVETLPKGVSVHEPNYNIVQWLHWDTAGFAYANMMADPLTGETLQSHVYMTSVFGNGGYRRAKIYLQRYKAMAKTKAEEEHSHGLKIAGFESAHVCGFTYDKAMHDLEGIVKEIEKDGETTEEEKEKIFKRFAQDYVRQVVAHEVGHTLGLRHNFAGSLKTNIDPRLFDTVSKVYFLSGELIPGMIPGGTVMDYTPSMFSAMIGAHIRLERPGLSYDQQAIEFGYTDKKASKIAFDTFCTDTHRGKGLYQDCKVWDQFANPITGASFDLNNAVPFRAFALANGFAFLDPNHKDEEAVDLSNMERIAKIKLDPRKDAQKLLKDNLVPLMAMTTEKAQFIDIRNDYDTVGSLEEDEYLEKTRSFQAESIKKNGGLAKLFISHLSVEENKVQIAEQLATEFSKQFDKLYKEATAEEKEAVNQKMATYFEAFEKEVTAQMLKHLNGHSFAMKEEGFGKAVAQVADALLFTESDKIVGTSSNGAVVKEYLFQHEKAGIDLRAEAAKLAGRDFFPFSPSYMRGQSKLTKELKAKHKATVDTILADTTEDDLSDELFDWLVFEKKRLSPLK